VAAAAVVLYLFIKSLQLFFEVAGNSRGGSSEEGREGCIGRREETQPSRCHEATRGLHYFTISIYSSCCVYFHGFNMTIMALDGRNTDLKQLRSRLGPTLKGG